MEQQSFNLIIVLNVIIALLGSGGMMIAVYALRQNKDTLRLLYEGAAPQTQQLLRNTALGIEQLGQTLDEITAPTTTTTTTTATVTPVVVATPIDAQSLKG